MRTVLIPMMGRGARFHDAGYQEPKPFIRLGGLRTDPTILDKVLESLPTYDRLLIVGRKSFEYHLSQYGGDHLLLADETKGAAHTVSIGAKLIDPESEVLVINCDNYVTTDWKKFFAAQQQLKTAAAVMTFPVPPGPDRWSYIYSDSEDMVFLSMEKERVVTRGDMTEEACAGVYWFRTALNMKSSLGAYLKQGSPTNGEYYMTPMFNFMTRQRINAWRVDEFHDLGTPEALKAYLERNAA